MGRAYRYVRRISHIEIALAERGKSGERLATVVGEERQAAPAKKTAKPKTKAVSKAKAKKPAKKKAAAKK
jgi:large subunit ribosomal protein L22